MKYINTNKTFIKLLHLTQFQLYHTSLANIQYTYIVEALCKYLIVSSKDILNK